MKMAEQAIYDEDFSINDQWEQVCCQLKNEFGESNSYSEILKKAENKREAEDRLNELLPKLEILDKVTLDSVLTEFETKVASF